MRGFLLFARFDWVAVHIEAVENWAHGVAECVVHFHVFA